ncbi:MAG: MgtC/SapB family protein [Clostridiales bacterium]|nr:MgtC/SapB family protein [Clostridiales bacterium]
MSEALHYLESFNNTSILVRLLLATLFGCFIGMERAAKRQIAGIKTFALVCLGAALATIVNIYLWDLTNGVADASRIPAGVISGIGFLGVGTIIITRKNQVRGLTTAAGLWVAATLGIAVGSGMIFMSAVAFVLIIITIHFLPYLDNRQRESNRIIGLYLEIDPVTGTGQLMEYLGTSGYTITSLEKRRQSKNSDLSLLLELDLGRRQKHHDIIAELSHVEGVNYLEET